MKTKTTRRTDAPSTATSQILQKLFLIAAGLSVVAQALEIFYMVAQQWPYNQNLSAYTWWVISQSLTIGIWLLIWISRRQRDFSLKTLFDTTLLTACLLLLAVSVGPLMQIAPMPWVNGDTLVFFTTAMPLVVTLPVAAIIILRLRATKQW